ncbi:unnamed protein product [Heligmosomoides polygyrus]|uniref:Uncharacterized protein n=1 Tax=Heligmosomoides polygyrus TaxID=6339 RepID=A0A183F5S9_HELPZ|nr:unnamed protein product [Heligmosomoides polygyrus]
MRGYRMMAPSQMFGPPPPFYGRQFSPCGGGGPCGQRFRMPISQPCGGFGGCGQQQQQQIAYGVPDPIYTESGRIIQAPFLPPSGLPPLPVQENNLFNYGK